jgi:hypothetical protein
MKKILSIIILVVISFSIAFSQTPEKEIAAEKDFSVYFPKAGDIAIGVDMGNLIKFTGNSIFGNTDIGSDIDAVNAFQSNFFGKYFLSNDMALRARLGIGVNNSKTREFVRDDFAFLNDPFTNQQTVDTRFLRSHGIELGIGMELRRSLWRVQGYAGAEVFFGYERRNLYYEYGNDITAANQLPSTTLFVNNGTVENLVHPEIAYAAGNDRILQKENRYILNYGGGLFMGADLFLSRNISVGVEFKLEARASYEGEQIVVAEGWRVDDKYNLEVYDRRDVNITVPASTSFQLKPITYLSLMFYF